MWAGSCMLCDVMQKNCRSWVWITVISCSILSLVFALSLIQTRKTDFLLCYPKLKMIVPQGHSSADVSGCSCHSVPCTRWINRFPQAGTWQGTFLTRWEASTAPGHLLIQPNEAFHAGCNGAARALKAGTSVLTNSLLLRKY